MTNKNPVVGYLTNSLRDHINLIMGKITTLENKILRLKNANNVINYTESDIEQLKEKHESKYVGLTRKRPFVLKRLTPSQIKQNELFIVQYEKEKKNLETELTILKEDRTVLNAMQSQMENFNILNNIQDLKKVLKSNNLSNLIQNSFSISPRNLSIKTLLNAVEQNNFKAFRAEKVVVNGRKRLTYIAKNPLTADDVNIVSAPLEKSKYNF